MFIYTQIYLSDCEGEKLNNGTCNDQCCELGSNNEYFNHNPIIDYYQVYLMNEVNYFGSFRDTPQ